jgi:putative oxygen-independent coproporphyrinogen III oxidase
MDSYVESCVRQAAADLDGSPGITSLFIGGGTPSQLPPALVAKLVGAIPLAPGAEVTLEANPEDVDADRLGAWRQAGVNRVSLGVQSTSASVLHGLGRPQDPGQLPETLAAVSQAGLATWSVDLIYGAAVESDEDWASTLDTVLAFGPPHLSAYALTVEPGTVLAADPARHPDFDVQARRYEEADRRLQLAGMSWYEVSNWSMPGHACRHNQLYWAQGDYLGIGCAAHSHQNGRRWWNLRNPQRFIAAVAEGTSVVTGEETLTMGQRHFEAVLLGLRTVQGVPLEWLDPEALASLPAGLVVVSGGRAVLTCSGRLLANDLSVRLAGPVAQAVAEAAGSARRWEDEDLPGIDQVGHFGIDQTIGVGRDQAPPVPVDLDVAGRPST